MSNVQTIDLAKLESDQRDVAKIIDEAEQSYLDDAIKIDHIQQVLESSRMSPAVKEAYEKKLNQHKSELLEGLRNLTNPLSALMEEYEMPSDLVMKTPTGLSGAKTQEAQVEHCVEWAVGILQYLQQLKQEVFEIDELIGELANLENF